MGYQLYQGNERLCFSFDIGNETSGASYVHLLPSRAPVPKRIHEWPLQNSSRIPTRILYDQKGKARAIGAEVNDDALEEGLRLGEDWTEAKAFKLAQHLKPPPITLWNSSSKASQTSHVKRPDPPDQPLRFDAPPLPEGVSVHQCYVDFIRYLYDHVSATFQAEIPDGPAIWGRLKKGGVHLVLTHPENWDENKKLSLKAAVSGAGIMGIGEREERVTLLTQSEAAVHAVVKKATVDNWGFSASSNFGIVDAGSSLVDICLWKFESTSPLLKLRKMKRAHCMPAGSSLIMAAAEQMLEEKLQGSQFDTPDYIAEMVRGFETTVLHNFGCSEESFVIQFGYKRDTDLRVGIEKGRLTLSYSEVQQAFEPCLKAIVMSVLSQVAGCSVKNIVFIGALSRSSYLRDRIKSSLQQVGIRLFTDDERADTFVTDGGVLCAMQDPVVTRTTSFELGVSSVVQARKAPREIRSREIIRMKGESYITGKWKPLVLPGRIIEYGAVIKVPMSKELKHAELSNYSIPLISYTGDGTESYYLDGWCTDASGKRLDYFVDCCTLTADFSHYSKNTEAVYKISFELVIYFGVSENRACFTWKENGQEVRGPSVAVRV